MIERPRSLLALFGFAVAVAAVSTVSSWITLPEVPRWYRSLVHPSWGPPESWFGPVWTALYVIMALAAWGVWRAPDSGRRTNALLLWWLQLAANLGWPLIFFGLHMMGLAFAEVLGLTLLLVLAVVAFWQVSRGSALLLVPYLAWVCFAASLSGAYWRVNG